VRGERSLYIIVVEIIPTMTSLIVASFPDNALYAVLFLLQPAVIGARQPSVDQLGNHAVLAGERGGVPDRPAAVDHRARPVHRRPLAPGFALLNYAF